MLVGFNIMSMPRILTRTTPLIKIANACERLLLHEKVSKIKLLSSETDILKNQFQMSKKKI